MTKPFKADVLVVKLSGKALTADKALDALFAALAGSAASAERTRVVLVHGGGVEVDALMRGLGRRIDRIEGLRVSPAEDMPGYCRRLGRHLQPEAARSCAKGGADASGTLRYRRRHRPSRAGGPTLRTRRRD